MLRKFLFTANQIGLSFRMAVESVVINKLRTALSLLGITIGIFAIISVFTVIDSLESNIRSNVDAFGSNMIYIEQWPWTPPEEDQGEYRWWKYANRPVVTYKEFQEINELLPHIETSVFAISFQRGVKVGNDFLGATEIIGSTYDYDRVRKVDIDRGRYFTPYESENGAQVAIIGAELADKFFGKVDPLGQTVRLAGGKIEVIGVLKKEGDNMFGASSDWQMLVPYIYARTISNPRWANPQIILKGNGTNQEAFNDEATSLMRRLRRLGPTAESNFAVNTPSAVNKQLDSIFTMINLAGGLIGIFSILVGGFGVANIMFVSVQERIMQIGIQKALGARPYFILLQFLFEAILLSVVGGAVGLGLIYLGATIVSSVTSFTVSLSLGNIVLGLLISSVVGAVSGIFPAYNAAKMEPVKAIFKT